MRVFPENIDNAAFFTSSDGRMTTEAQLLVERAKALLQNGRNCNDTDDLRKAIAIVFLFWRVQGFPRPLTLVLAGIVSGAIDRGLYGFLRRAGMRVCESVLEGIGRAQGMDGNAPGWNDYVMAYWMMTGNPDAVEELYRRATDPVTDSDLLPMKESAEWMVSSVRAQCAEFDRAWREVEACEGGTHP